MSVEENIALVERWRQAVNSRDLEGVIGCYAPDAYVWSPRLEIEFGPDGIKGQNAIRSEQQVFFDTWPDGTVGRDQVFASGDNVCLLGSIGGTHTLPYTVLGGKTYPPTGEANDGQAIGGVHDREKPDCYKPQALRLSEPGGTGRSLHQVTGIRRRAGR